MLNSGKKNHTLCDKKNKHCVVQKKISDRKKPP